MEQFLIVCPLVFLAGFVDSIAGGGGLISFPAYMLAGVPVHVILGTSKLSAFPGSIVAAPFSVVVLGKFRRFLLVIFLSLFLHLDFSFIYSKFSMPFWGFFY